MPPELRLKANAFSGARALNAAVLATEQQIEKIREDQKKSFIHSLTFKIITFGIGIKISNSQKETDERRINELKDGVKALYRRLDDAIRLKNETESRTFTSGDFSVQMADEAVHFRMEEDGRLFARMADNPDEKEYALTASVENLRYKLAEDMFSHPDLFDRKELKDMLPVPTKRENRQQQLSTEGTYERHVFMLAIKSRSNIGGASLENVTTANLRDLAQAALDTDGDADAVTEELKRRLETINQTISANRLTTVEAETMVEAFRAQTDEVKQTITVAPTMEKAPPPSKAQFSDISYNAFKPLRSSVLTEDLRKKFITDDAIKSDADKKRYKQAFEELWGELENFGKVRKELGETVFPDYLKKLMEAADKKNDVDVKGSIAYFKARICHYLFDTADGRQRVDEANRNLRIEWAKVVEAEGRIDELHVRVQNEFEKADLACLKKVRDENKRLGKVLPKRRPRSFIDCMSDVLKQNALATVNRVDKGLILLHQMA